MRSIDRFLLSFSFLFLFSVECVSQDLLSSSMLWSGVLVSKKINKKIRFNLGDLHSVNMTDGVFSFNQSSFSTTYKVKKNLKIKLEYSLGVYRWNNNLTQLGLLSSGIGTTNIHRFTGGVSNRKKINKRFKIKQSIEAQVYFPRLYKYKVRSFYKAKFYYNPKKTPFSSVFFVETKLFYFFDGMPIVYRDSDNKIVDYASTDGIHRARLKVGVRFVPIKNKKSIKVILYYMAQKEFNIKGVGNEINVLTPAEINANYLGKQKVLYPFNDYNVFGVHLLFNI